MYLLVRPAGAQKSTILVSLDQISLSYDPSFRSVRINDNLTIEKDDDGNDGSKLIARIEDVAAAAASDKVKIYDTGKSVGYWKKARAAAKSSPQEAPAPAPKK